MAEKPLDANLFAKMGGIEGVTGFSIPSKKPCVTDHVESLPEGVQESLKNGVPVVVDVNRRVFVLHESNNS